MPPSIAELAPMPLTDPSHVIKGGSPIFDCLAVEYSFALPEVVPKPDSLSPIFVSIGGEALHIGHFGPRPEEGIEGKTDESHVAPSEQRTETARRPLWRRMREAIKSVRRRDLSILVDLGVVASSLVSTVFIDRGLPHISAPSPETFPAGAVDAVRQGVESFGAFEGFAGLGASVALAGVYHLSRRRRNPDGWKHRPDRKQKRDISFADLERFFTSTENPPQQPTILTS